MIRRLINSQTSLVRYQFVFMNASSAYFPFSTNFPRKIQFSSWGFFNIHYYFFSNENISKEMKFHNGFLLFRFRYKFPTKNDLFSHDFVILFYSLCECAENVALKLKSEKILIFKVPWILDVFRIWISMRLIGHSFSLFFFFCWFVLKWKVN